MYFYLFIKIYVIYLTLPPSKLALIVIKTSVYCLQLSVFGGSAWTRDATRGEFYYHQFLDSQPDLNLRNEDVQEELKKILEFWLNKGVDGFRIDAAGHLFESNNTAKDEPSVNGTEYNSLEHTLTTFQPETFELISTWRELLNGFNKDGDSYRYVYILQYIY